MGYTHLYLHEAEEGNLDLFAEVIGNKAVEEE